MPQILRVPHQTVSHGRQTVVKGHIPLIDLLRAHPRPLRIGQRDRKAKDALRVPQGLDTPQGVRRRHLQVRHRPRADRLIVRHNYHLPRAVALFLFPAVCHRQCTPASARIFAACMRPPVRKSARAWVVAST